jgi:hypothetical protein
MLILLVIFIKIIFIYPYLKGLYKIRNKKFNNKKFSQTVNNS